MACTCIGFGLYFFVHGLVFCSFMDGWLQVYAYLGRLGRRQAASWMVGYKYLHTWDVMLSFLRTASTVFLSMLL